MRRYSSPQYRVRIESRKGSGVEVWGPGFAGLKSGGWLRL